MKKAIYALVASLTTLPVSAEITDVAANGFTTVNEVVVEATPEMAWAEAIAVGRWWSSDHTISGDAARMSIEPVPQGCFCESLGDAAGVVHLVVTSVMPATSLRLTGGLGPLGLMGVNGNMTWEFAESDAGSAVTLTYAVGGYLDGGLDAVALAVDGVLVEQMMRLKTYAESRASGSMR